MNLKSCTGCGKLKSNNDFYADRRTPSGLQSRCKSCFCAAMTKYRKANSEVIRRKDRKRYSKNYDPVRQRMYHLRRKYGITPEQYQELLTKQDHRCAICRRHEDELKTRLAVDHRHAGPKRGEVTGLLCTFCNHKFIGRNWDPVQFERAAAYLRQGTGWFVPEKIKKKKRKSRG